MLGDLGHDRDFLCRDRALLSLVSQPWTVSRPSMVKAKRPCVMTQQVCRDRVAQRAHTSVRGSMRYRCSIHTAMCTTTACALARQGSARDRARVGKRNRGLS